MKKMTILMKRQLTVILFLTISERLTVRNKKNNTKEDIRPDDRFIINKNNKKKDIIRKLIKIMIMRQKLRELRLIKIHLLSKLQQNKKNLLSYKLNYDWLEKKKRNYVKINRINILIRPLLINIISNLLVNGKKLSKLNKWVNIIKNRFHNNPHMTNN